MTTEEKAKAYDMALEGARKELGVDRKEWEVVQRVLHNIFPELAESDDERIRKHLVGIVELYWGKTNDPDKVKDLAWLKKQKENIEKEYVFRPLAGTDINTAALQAIRRANEGDRLVLAFNGAYIPVRKGCNANKIVDIYEAFIEKQKEQKPAELETLGKPMTHEEWAEDYWEHHKFASSNGNDKCDVIQFEHKGFIDFCMAYCVDQKPQDRLVLHDTFGYEKGRQVGQREGVEMVLKTPESYGLYKPAEWSEEDKNKLNHILEIVHIAPGREVSVDEKEELESFLKSLRPQPQLEWSEDYREEDIQTRFAFYTYKDDSSELYLSNVFVEEASRNHGFGTKILRAAEKVAETIGATTICLKVKQDSPANAWYRKNGYGYVAFEDGYDWLEKNLEYMKPNKQEWSEEDEKMVKEALYCVGYTFGSTHPLVAWLKSLSSNLKKKNEDIEKLCSNEWSEEDEKMFDDIISDIEYNRDLEDAQLTDFYNKQIHFLKSLRRSINFQSNRVWNEEDEKMLKWTEDILLIADGDLSDKLNGKVSSITDSAYSSIKICIAQCLSWLKSLHPQPKRNCKDCAMFLNGECTKPHWKPSEDEERLINTSISFLKDFADKGYENAVECIDWLKSKLYEKSINA